MKKRTALTVMLALAAFGAAYAQTTVQRSLYVSAQGDDSNNGRSEATPYKTLEKAVEMANAGVIKTIMVIGTITTNWERFAISQSGADEILVTGKPDASGAERAVISKEVYVDGKVRFTHIRLTRVFGSATVTLGAGAVVANNPFYAGVEVQTVIMTDDATITGCARRGVIGSTITMSDNASITNNYGGISGETVTMSGNAKVSDNKSRGVSCVTLTMSENAKISGNVNSSPSGYDGGGGVKCGTLTMSENAEISGNVSSRNDAGGVYVSSLNMSGNAKIINNTSSMDGGGAYVSDNSTISGNALISGNTAKNGGGIYFTNYRGNPTLTIEGGEISNNKAEYGAGVYVVGGNTFNHKGGIVTGNNAEYVGGGVYVQSRGTYTAGGGKVSGNIAGDGGDEIFRQ